MLPNHAPLAVAESFRVLEGLHPGRIDLGLGRAPGTDQLTAYALRRGRVEADEFPQQFVRAARLRRRLPRRAPLQAAARDPGRRTPAAAVDPRLLPVRRPGGRRVRDRVRVRGALRVGRPGGGGGRLPRAVRAVGAAGRAAGDPRGRRDRRRDRGAGRGAGPGQRPLDGAADAEPARPAAHARGGSGARLDRAGAPARRAAPPVHLGRAPPTRSATTSSAGAPTPTPTSWSSPPRCTTRPSECCPTS